MAIVKLGQKVKTNLSGALAYTINPAKTDGGRLVYAGYSGERHDARLLAKAMMRDLESCANGMREGGVLALHLKHSFAPGEAVSPERVHELGIALAEAITGGEYRYVVSTHLDRHHLHNHIVICAANRRTHRKMRLTRRSIDQWRAISDELCRREGLTTLRNPAIEVESGRVDMPRVMERTPGEDAASTPAMPPKTVTANGLGVSMEELYASVKGRGTKERMRAMIELAAATAGDCQEFEANLAAARVGVALRGTHLTYTDLDTGFRIRDARLGPAYDLDSVLARVNGGETLHLTFNQRLVAGQNERTARVWLPGSHRSRKAVIPADALVQDGSTWHLFLPMDHRITLLDRSNRYAGRTDADGLADLLGRPGWRLEPLTTDKRILIRHGVTPAQQRYYQVQARRLDELQTITDGLNEAIRLRRETGGSLLQGLRDLANQTDTARAELRATVVALSDAIANGDTDLAIETQMEMRRREQTLERCEHRYAAIIQGARLAGIDVTGLGIENSSHIITGRETDDGRGGQDTSGRTGQRIGAAVACTIAATDHGNGRRGGADSRMGGRDGSRTGLVGRPVPGTPAAAGSDREREEESLIKQSKAQEAAFRSQRDQQETERSRAQRERMRRKGRAL